MPAVPEELVLWRSGPRAQLLHSLYRPFLAQADWLICPQTITKQQELLWLQVVTLHYKGQELLWVTGSYKVLQSMGVALGAQLRLLLRSNKREGESLVNFEYSPCCKHIYRSRTESWLAFWMKIPLQPNYLYLSRDKALLECGCGLNCALLPNQYIEVQPPCPPYLEMGSL